MIPILSAVQQSCYIINQDNLNQGNAGLNKFEHSGSQQPNHLSTHSFLGVCIIVGQFKAGFFIFFMSLGHVILHFGTSSPVINVRNKPTDVRARVNIGIIKGKERPREICKG